MPHYQAVSVFNLGPSPCAFKKLTKRRLCFSALTAFLILSCIFAIKKARVFNFIS